MTTTEGFTIRVDWQGGACPHQAEGVLIVNGVEYPFYFRYRQDHAQFYIWEPDHEHEFFDDRYILLFREEDDVESREGYGWMSDEETSEFIQRWAGEFVQGLDHEQ